MEQFLQDLLCGSPLLLRSIAAMLLAATACGIAGTYVVLRRESYAVGAVSHSLLGGIGIALFCRAQWQLAWLTPWLGALMAALLVPFLLTWFTVKLKMRTDTVLSAIWALGMALGISFITAMPGYQPDLNSYLFGSILMIAPADLLTIAILDGVIALIALAWHQRFVILAFHQELLGLRGISITATQLAMQLVVAMTVVILSQLVGVVLCIALLILPVAAAAALCRRIPRIMLLAAILCMACCLGGIAISYERLPGGILLSPGATIVELAALCYFIATAISKLRSHLA